MKMRSLMSVVCPLATTTVGLFSVSANALTLANSSGTWSNVVGAGGTVESQTVSRENQIRWGGPAIGTTIDDKSGLGFTGVDSSSFSIGTSFTVGTLRHFNKPIAAGTGATSADLTVDLLFSDPAINPSFNFTFAINETPNAAPCLVGEPPCADIISFSDAFASEIFTVSGVEYTLELLGFQTATGDLVSQFISEENGAANSATLFARVTVPPPPPIDVPEPGAIAALSAIGLYLFAQRYILQ
jgi:hypothetical protein